LGCSQSGFKLPEYIDAAAVKCAQIVPTNAGLKLHVIYEVAELPETNVAASEELVAAVDLGVNKLATLAFSDTSIQARCWDGAYLKSAASTTTST